MSKRKLVPQVEPVELRKELYVQQINRDIREEALWEALDRLEAQGLDLGPKATEVLAKRRRIKEKVPKAG
jgi:hypothetical protein